LASVAPTDERLTADASADREYDVVFGRKHPGVVLPASGATTHDYKSIYDLMEDIGNPYLAPTHTLALFA